jgi:hypothetical protein
MQVNCPQGVHAGQTIMVQVKHYITSRTAPSEALIMRGAGYKASRPWRRGRAARTSTSRSAGRPRVAISRLSVLVAGFWGGFQSMFQSRPYNVSGGFGTRRDVAGHFRRLEYA